MDRRACLCLLPLPPYGALERRGGPGAKLSGDEPGVFSLVRRDEQALPADEQDRGGDHGGSEGRGGRVLGRCVSPAPAGASCLASASSI
eukprot:scaffold153057_cov22-Tisochrysis_lutea.AAC.1